MWPRVSHFVPTGPEWGRDECWPWRGSGTVSRVAAVSPSSAGGHTRSTQDLTPASGSGITLRRDHRDIWGAGIESRLVTCKASVLPMVLQSQGPLRPEDSKCGARARAPKVAWAPSAPGSEQGRADLTPRNSRAAGPQQTPSQSGHQQGSSRACPACCRPSRTGGLPCSWTSRPLASPPARHYQIRVVPVLARTSGAWKFPF